MSQKEVKIPLLKPETCCSPTPTIAMLLFVMRVDGSEVDGGCSWTKESDPKASSAFERVAFRWQIWTMDDSTVLPITFHWEVLPPVWSKRVNSRCPMCSRAMPSGLGPKEGAKARSSRPFQSDVPFLIPQAGPAATRSKDATSSSWPYY